eukprot:jgi/Mesvir1/23508/Mv22350-RA.1
MKIIDKINESIAAEKTFFSFEFFPPKTDEGLAHLWERMERMAAYEPTFCDITWGAGGSTHDLTLDIASKMQNKVGVETMMHLTCTNITVESIKSAIAAAKEYGITNILALRGDPPKGQDKFTATEGGLTCALDLVKLIRAEHGDYFGIGVAGYPEGHPDKIGADGMVSDEDYAADIDYLKQKVEAGADFIVTQLFYDCELFLKFVRDCRAAGITVPIVPGIMPIATYGGFKRMTGFCKTRIPEDIATHLEGIKENEEEVKKYGVELGVAMCRKLLDSGLVAGLHMYSLNQPQGVLAILQGVGIIGSEPPAKQG